MAVGWTHGTGIAALVKEWKFWMEPNFQTFPPNFPRRCIGWHRRHQIWDSKALANAAHAEWKKTCKHTHTHNFRQWAWSQWSTNCPTLTPPPLSSPFASLFSLPCCGSPQAHEWKSLFPGELVGRTRERETGMRGWQGGRGEVCESGHKINTVPLFSSIAFPSFSLHSPPPPHPVLSAVDTKPC